VSRLKGHRGRVNCLLYSREECVLFSGGGDNSVRIWNVKNGEYGLLKIIDFKKW
jgi:WD40 repeat protein